MRTTFVLDVGAGEVEAFAQSLTQELPPELDSDIDVSITEDPLRSGGGPDWPTVVALVTASVPVFAALIQAIAKVLAPGDVIIFENERGEKLTLPEKATAAQIRAAAESLATARKPSGKVVSRKKA